MLKTLRVTSLVTVILAAVGVIAIVVMGLKGDSQIKDFLAKPGIVDELRSKSSLEGTQEDKSSPLVALAKAIALRFDPPPPPKPKVKDKPPVEIARVKPVPPVIPKPKVQTSIKSDLLATVLYESAPGKSLALLQTTKDKQEWFRQGEKVGHLEIKEIRDGSVVFTQGGRNPQEKFVPAKPQVKSLLKGDKTTSTIQRPASSSVTTRVTASDLPKAAGSGASPTAKTTDSGKISVVRSGRPDTSTRIQRVRSTPPLATVRQEKESLENTLSGIEEIMISQKELLTGEEHEEENEMWMKVAEILAAEKKQLEKIIETQSDSAKDGAEIKGKASEKDVGESKPDQPEESGENKPQDTEISTPADPNKP